MAHLPTFIDDDPIPPDAGGISWKWGLSILVSLLIMILMWGWSNQAARLDKSEDRINAMEVHYANMDAKVDSIKETVSDIKRVVEKEQKP